MRPEEFDRLKGYFLDRRAETVTKVRPMKSGLKVFIKGKKPIIISQFVVDHIMRVTRPVERENDILSANSRHKVRRSKSLSRKAPKTRRPK